MVEINNFYFLLLVNFLVFFEKCKIFFNSLLVFKLELIFRAIVTGVFMFNNQCRVCFFEVGDIF